MTNETIEGNEWAAYGTTLFFPILAPGPLRQNSSVGSEKASTRRCAGTTRPVAASPAPAESTNCGRSADLVDSYAFVPSLRVISLKESLLLVILLNH